MTPERLSECLRVVRWQADTLAETLDVPSDVAAGWVAGTDAIPRKVGAWMEALCFVHESAEATKPPTSGEGYSDGARREFIPVYAYNLLRSLNQSPIPLKALFGSDDEGAVFFLVSRGLAVREGEQLMITDAGTSVGSMSI